MVIRLVSSSLSFDEIRVLASLTRADLQYIGLPENVIQQFADEDMAAIASRLEDLYRDNQFPIDLDIEASLLLEGKRLQGNENNTSNG